MDAVDIVLAIDTASDRWLDRYDVDHQARDLYACVYPLGVALRRLDDAGDRCVAVHHTSTGSLTPS